MTSAPINAPVDCADGQCGTSLRLIVQPLTRKITHLVVLEEGGSDAVERLVPVDQVAGVTRGRITLHCSKAELADFEPFIEKWFRLSTRPNFRMAPYDPTGMLIGTVPTESFYVPEQIERVPEGEIAVGVGTKVQARDGEVGNVIELVVDPSTREVTHFVFEHGRGTLKQETVLPLSVIDDVADDTVHLRLDKGALELLPSVPARSRGGPWAGAEIDLVGVVFEDTNRAQEMLDFVMQTSFDGRARIRNAAVLVKRNDHEISVREQGDLTTRDGAFAGALIGGVVGLLTGGIGLLATPLLGAAAGAGMARVSDRGFSDNFLRSLAERLQPGCSGLLLVVEHDWVAPLQQVLAGEKRVFLQQPLTDLLITELTGQPTTGRAEPSPTT
jgi:uncharacterized membrane protein